MKNILLLVVAIIFVACKPPISLGTGIVTVYDAGGQVIFSSARISTVYLDYGNHVAIFKFNNSDTEKLQTATSAAKGIITVCLDHDIIGICMANSAMNKNRLQLYVSHFKSLDNYLSLAGYNTCQTKVSDALP
jgi:hypothetical protein